MCRGTPGLLMMALPADLRASIPEVCPLSGQVDSPDLRLRPRGASTRRGESWGVGRAGGGEMRVS